MMIDVEALLQPVSEADPAGPELRTYAEAEIRTDYNSLYTDLDAIVPRLDETIRKEDAEPALRLRRTEDATAHAGIERSVALLGKSKDLWIASYGFCFAVCAGDLEVGAGFLEVMAGLCERHWPHCHPALETETSEPAAGRREACRQVDSLRHAAKHIQRAPLLPLRSRGWFSLRDLTAGAPATAGIADLLALASPPMAAAIDASEAASWTAFSDLLAGMAKALQRVRSAFSEHAPGFEPDFGKLLEALDKVKALSDGVVKKLNPNGAAAADAGVPPGEGVAAPQPAGSGPSGSAATRAQALAHLDAARAYFAAAEPSSPVILMIDRVKKVAGMDFMQIINSLAPSGVDEATRILAPEPPPSE